MRLLYPQPPIPGQYFQLSVEGYVQAVTLHWYLDDILIHTGGCPDPPCYDVFRVPVDAHGKTLHIVATGEAETKTLRLVIGNTITINNPAAAAEEI